MNRIDCRVVILYPRIFSGGRFYLILLDVNFAFVVRTGKSHLANAVASRLKVPVFLVDPIEVAIAKAGLPLSFETGLRIRKFEARNRATIRAVARGS